METDTKTRLAVASALVSLFVWVPLAASADTPKGVSVHEFVHAEKGWTRERLQNWYDVKGTRTSRNTASEVRTLTKIYPLTPKYDGYVFVLFKTKKGGTIYYAIQESWCQAGVECLDGW